MLTGRRSRAQGILQHSGSGILLVHNLGRYAKCSLIGTQFRSICKVLSHRYTIQVYIQSALSQVHILGRYSKCSLIGTHFRQICKVLSSFLTENLFPHTTTQDTGQLLKLEDRYRGYCVHYPGTLKSALFLAKPCFGENNSLCQINQYYKTYLI